MKEGAAAAAPSRFQILSDWLSEKRVHCHLRDKTLAPTVLPDAIA
jgi:hypothetical protein